MIGDYLVSRFIFYISIKTVWCCIYSVVNKGIPVAFRVNTELQYDKYKKASIFK